MSELNIRVAQFPNILQPKPEIAARVRFTIVGTITKIEDDVVDITSYGGLPRTTPGERKVTILVEGIEPA